MNTEDVWEMQLSRVNANGFAMTYVMPTDSAPSMTYTIGMAGRGFPDLVIFDLSSVLAATLIGTLAKHILSSKSHPVDGQVFEEISNFPLKVSYTTEPRALDVNRYCREYSLLSKVMRVVCLNPEGLVPREEKKPARQFGSKRIDCALDVA